VSESSVGRELIVRGRTIRDADLEMVRQLVQEHGSRGRSCLARLLAERWNWRQPNGRVKHRACAEVLRALQAQGLVELPKPGRAPAPSSAPARPPTLDTRPLRGALKEWLPFRFQLVQTSAHARVFKYVIEAYHYLGYRSLVGTSLRYLVYSGDRVVAALGWQSAVKALACRDRVIGWSAAQREEDLHRVATNTRFLILPWVSLPHAASHILGRMIRRLNADWEATYGYGLWLLETFVDGTRFAGTSYQAANWVWVGQSKGFAKARNGFVYHGHRKEVYLYVLDPWLRHHIGCADATDPPLTPEYLLSRVESATQMERRASMIVRRADWDPDVPPTFDLSAEDVPELAEELEAFHGLFEEAFYRKEQVGLSQCYLQGLLTSLDRKSMEPIALKLHGPKQVRSLQRFMSQYQWDDELLAQRHEQELSKTLASPDGVWSVDSSEFVKKGRESVGVARQYCGRLGKIENCQSGVFVGYSSAKGYGLVDGRLYLPESWFSPEQKDRREKCKVPEDLTFKTKPELAAEMLQALTATELFPAQWVTCDTVFGNSPTFLQSLPEGLYYLAEIPCNRQVWCVPSSGSVEPSTPTRSVQEVAQDPCLGWERVTLAEGAKGPIVGEVARLRIVVSDDGKPGPEQWLFLRRMLDTGEVKYCLSNAPVDTPLRDMTRVCMLRWPIEQCFQEGKSELGMADYEHRSWPAWHRHMRFVFLAQLFLRRVQQRWGKKSTRAHPPPGAAADRSGVAGGAV